MKYWLNKKILLLSLILLIVSGWVWLTTSINAKGVKHGVSKSLLHHINIHAEGEVWLQVNGVRFENVIGYEPYYLDIPNSNYIFFVQKDKDGGDVANFVSLYDDEIIKFEAFSVYSGWNVWHNNEDYNVTIEQYKDNKVTVLMRFEKKEIRCCFDLCMKTVIEKIK